MPENQIKIVRLTPAYQAGVLDVLGQSNNEHARRDTAYFVEIEKEKQEGYVSWIIKDKNNFGYVALDGEKIVGLLFAGKMRKPCTNRISSVYYIFDIAVEKEYRCQGIGRLLLEKVYRRAKQYKIGQVELSVFSSNKNAVQFYNHLGYKEISTNLILDL